MSVTTPSSLVASGPLGKDLEVAALRAGAIVTIGLIALVGAACSGSRPHSTGVSNCGGGPVVTGPHGTQLPLASCSGEVGLGPEGPELVLHAGQTATISGLEFGYTDARASDPKLIRVTATGTSARVRALHSGTAEVFLTTDFCMGKSSTRCPVLRVTVVT
jgi:hypothetical protein